jgi:hypothetical protein
LVINCKATPKDLSASESDPNLSDLSSLAKTENLPRVALVAVDVVEVKVWYTLQFRETRAVRADGRIVFQIAGDIEIQRKDPAGL